jgi:hypothetical protein
MATSKQFLLVFQRLDQRVRELTPFQDIERVLKCQLRWQRIYFGPGKRAD